MNDPASGLSMDPDAKVDGRTREGRAIRAQQAASREQRTSPRQTATHEPMRDPARGGVVAYGRNGEILTRTRREEGKDIFYVPEELKEAGWAYQWCAISVAGNADILTDQNMMLQDNGWRPAMSDKLVRYFMPAGKKGPVIRGQQMLMELPAALKKEAEEENIAKAKAQMRDRDQSLMGGKAALRAAMRDGFEMGGKYRGTGGDLKMSIDPGLDVPRPQHELADPGE